MGRDRYDLQLGIIQMCRKPRTARWLATHFKIDVQRIYGPLRSLVRKGCLTATEPRPAEFKAAERGIRWFNRAARGEYSSRVIMGLRSTIADVATVESVERLNEQIAIK